MFGHDDKPKDDDNHFGGEQHSETVIAPAASDDGTDSNNDWQHPGTPLKDDADDHKTESFTAGQGAPAVNDHAASADDAIDSSDAVSGTPAAAHPNDLLDIKQDALGKLSPLIGHLDQEPDEKFRTLMMMIQASDDQSLIQQAYDTALEITDEKTRAQALLDIVNEINYFTQNPKNG